MFEKQTPVPSKLVYVPEPLEVRAAVDGTQLIARGPAPDGLIEAVLRRLWLSRNRIGARGAATIAQMIGLDDLALDGNQLDDAGVRALAPLRGLSKLSVKDNPFRDPDAVLAALRHTAAAVEVEVEDDPYDIGGIM